MLLLLSVAVAVLSSFLFGYDSGVVSGAVLVLRDDFGNFGQKNEALLVSITEAFAAASSIFGIWSNHCLGRKATIALSAFLYLLASLLMSTAPLGRSKSRIESIQLIENRFDRKINSFRSTEQRLLTFNQSIKNLWIENRLEIDSVETGLFESQSFENSFEKKNSFEKNRSNYRFLEPSISLPLLIAGRAVAGSAIGLSSMTVPPYIAEVAPPKVRGRLVTLVQVMITGGFTVANFASAGLSYLGRNSWRYMLGLGALPALLQLTLVWLIPRSPRWLAQKGRLGEARVASAKVGITLDDGDLDGAMGGRGTSSRTKAPNLVKSAFRSRSVRKALVIGAGLQFFQQLCGINAVMYYAATILKMAGIRSNTQAMWWSALIAFVHLLATLPGMYLVERMGRRKLLLGSMIGTAISSAILGGGFLVIRLNSPCSIIAGGIQNESSYCAVSTCDACSYLQHCGFCYTTQSPNATMAGSCLALNTTSKTLDGPCKNLGSVAGSAFLLDVGFCPSQFAWIPILGMALYLCAFSFGFGSVVWTINAEIYPQWARGFGNALATFTNWAMDLIVSYAFLPLSDRITREGLFFLFTAITCCGIFFAYVLVPETKGRSLEQIEQELK